LFCLGTGAVSAWLTIDGLRSFSQVIQPPLTPPMIVFPIVWSILYVLMGISSAGVYTNRELNPEAARKGLEYYAISLALNFLWSIIFFGLSAALPAFICLLFLLYYIIRTILEYKKVKSWCAYLQIPYAVWVAFAGYLNAGIWLLNQ